jgi:hypothetical protein
VVRESPGLGLVSRADLLRVQHVRLTLEIDLAKLKKGAADPAAKWPHNGSPAGIQYTQSTC